MGGGKKHIGTPEDTALFMCGWDACTHKQMMTAHVYEA